ncbi:MAG: DUF1549 domain-containing protein [Planctomycetota bacterium]
MRGNLISSRSGSEAKEISLVDALGWEIQSSFVFVALGGRSRANRGHQPCYGPNATDKSISSDLVPMHRLIRALPLPPTFMVNRRALSPTFTSVPGLLINTIFSTVLCTILGIAGQTLTSYSACAASPDFATLPGVIDRRMRQLHDAESLRPAGVCDDATFLRRLTLDLAGRIPTLPEQQQFTADNHRGRAIDRLLASDDHHQFWGDLWNCLLIGDNDQNNVQGDLLRRWMQQQVAANRRLDHMVFDLLTASGTTSLDPPTNFMVANRDGPVLRIGRAFLSTQLDCAQCHDHPSQRWTNDDFNGMKRFFDVVRYRDVSGGIRVSDAPGQHGNNGPPQFLTGQSPQSPAWRKELALMVIRCKPFARSMAGRTWHWLCAQPLTSR